MRASVTVAAHRRRLVRGRDECVFSSSILNVAENQWSAKIRIKTRMKTRIKTPSVRVSENRTFYARVT